VGKQSALVNTPNVSNLKVRKADPVPAPRVKTTQRGSGDSVRLPDLELIKFESLIVAEWFRTLSGFRA